MLDSKRGGQYKETNEKLKQDDIVIRKYEC